MTLFKKIILTFLLFLSAAFTVEARVDYSEISTPFAQKLIYVQDEFLPIVDMQIAFKNAGIVHDDESKLGLGRIYLDLLNKFAFTDDYIALQKLLSRKAINLTFSADQDNFYIDLKFIANDWRYVAKILAKFFNEQDFSADLLAISKQDLLAKRNQNYKDSNYLLALNFQKLVFKGSKYSNSSYGDAETVNAIELVDVKNYHQGRFARDNLYMSVVGSISQSRLKSFMNIAFKNLANFSEFEAIDIKISEPFFQQVKYPEKKQVIIKSAIEIVPISDPKYFTYFLFDQIMGGSNFSSRLGRSLREKKALTYGVNSNLIEVADKNLWVVKFASNKDKYLQALEGFSEVLSSLETQPITQEELDLFKDRYQKTYEIYFATNDKIARYLLEKILAGLDPNLINTQSDKIAEITLDEINKVAKEFARFSDFRTVIIGNM